jgi:predicted nucleic acid-binding protein
LSLYLETSVLVAALTREPESARVQAWLAAQPADELAISAWVETEFSSALSLKLRTGKLETVERAMAMSRLSALGAASLTWVGIGPEHFRAAARYADRHELGLRAPDALHLAVAAGHGALLCTLDRRLTAAGLALGVETRLV